MFDHHNFKEIGLQSGEKLVEDLIPDIQSVEVDNDFLRMLIKTWERENAIYL